MLQRDKVEEANAPPGFRLLEDHEHVEVALGPRLSAQTRAV